VALSPPVADLLRARLQEEQPGRAAQLHHNAAAWYAGHGLADDAIGHAAAAGEMLWAARIIEQHFDLVYSTRGEAATIHRWLSVLPAEVVRSRPRLLLAQALMAATSGRLEVVEPLLDAVECAPPGWADELFEPAGGVVASYLINVPALTTLHRGYLAQFHGDAKATAQRARPLLSQGDLPGAARFPRETGLGPDDEPNYAREPGHLMLARILLAQDQPGQALALLDRLHAAAVAQDRTGSLIETGALRALALAAAGDEDAVTTSPRRSCSPARRATSGSSPMRARRWPRCSGGSSRPSVPARQPPRSRSAIWPGSSAPSAPDSQRAIPSLPASSTR
jgi:hypothetical protein